MVSDVFDNPVNSEKSICGRTSNIGTKCKLGGGGRVSSCIGCRVHECILTI